MPLNFFEMSPPNSQVCLPVFSNTGISSSPATLQLKLVKTLFLLMEKLKSGSPEKKKYIKINDLDCLKKCRIL